MILDTLNNAGKYVFAYPGIGAVLKAAASYSAESFPSGKLGLEKDQATLIFSQYSTHPADEAFAEAHRQNIDVMVMVEGCETVYVKPTENLRRIKKEYDPDSDVLIAEKDTDTTAVRLNPGSFLILFPQDAHSPGCFADGKQSPVKKIIGKVPV